MYHKHQLPCLHCQPHDYIRMVQHMIERCLLFQMSRDDCVKALAKHAKIEPIITLTVWKELLKENKGFFQAYFQAISPRQFNSKANKTLHANKFVKNQNLVEKLKTNGFFKTYPS